MDVFMEKMGELLGATPQGPRNFENPFGGRDYITRRRPVRDLSGKGLLRTPTYNGEGSEKGTEARRFRDEEVFLEPEEIEEDDDDLRHLKVVFPVFQESDEAKGWLQDCEEYFKIYGVKAVRRVRIAAMHLKGVPKSWYKSYIVGKRMVSWEEFCEDFVIRFGETNAEFVFEQFKNLTQKGSLSSYYDEFEKLRGRISEKIPGLPEDFFMENFTGGLKEETRRVVKLLNPEPSPKPTNKQGPVNPRTLNSTTRP